jgi:hypothetical protein
MTENFIESDSSSSFPFCSFLRLVNKKRKKLRIEKILPNKRGKKPGPGPYRSHIE